MAHMLVRQRSDQNPYTHKTKAKANAHITASSRHPIAPRFMRNYLLDVDHATSVHGSTQMRGNINTLQTMTGKAI